MKNIILLFVLIFFVGCTSDFEEINTNPNNPVDVQADLLLRKVIFDYTEQMAFEGFVAGSTLGQYFTAIDFNLFDRHSLTEAQFGGNPWDVIYPNLRDINLVLEKSRSSEVQKVYEGPALIMKAYMTAALTDLFGDVPYSEALNGKNGNVTPAYDHQSAIYLDDGGIIPSLELAIQQIDAYQGSQTLEGDLIYNGDLSKWKKLAGSLLIKSLVRISDVENVFTKLQAIHDSGEYIKTAEEDAVFTFTAGQPNNFRMSTARVGDFNLYVMSETIDEIFTKLDDPRRAIFFRPTANDPSHFVGLLNGPDASNLSISVADFSLSGRIFREDAGGLKGNIMTAWETGFFLAEAAARGLIWSNAKSLYESSIEQSFAYWGMDMPSDYLSRTEVAFNVNRNPLDQIGTQKWISNIINGYEGWIDYKRTGFPQLKTVSASLNGDLIPSRLPYPATEAALNQINYTTAAAAYDDNSVNAKMWWDIN